MTEWYEVENIESIDSPALVVYKERVEENIRKVLSMIGDVNRLRPHVKTHKMREVSLMLLHAGVSKFKCATIAEAEMLGMVAAPDVLLAYQPLGPKLQRFLALVNTYPATKFSCLIDNTEAAKKISNEGVSNGCVIPVYVDINVGMNRTGISPGKDATSLIEEASMLQGIQVTGLHAYDGHLRAPDLEQRKKDSDKAFDEIESLKVELVRKGFTELVVIVGGSPTFPIHAMRKGVECSPGTFIFWDKGYQMSCLEQPFLTAALVISRIISLPSENTLCLDLGHKSIASENELSKRVYFVNAPNIRFLAHSEEHLVVDAGANHSFKTGDVLFGLPHHICPTCALYEKAIVIENKKATTEWRVIARDRKITI